jgi:hypothetical protein
MQSFRESVLVSRSWRSSVVEQLTCNQQVRGSNPFASSTTKPIAGCRIRNADYKKSEVGNPQPAIEGEVAEWTKAADCKSAGVSLRRFESFPPHHVFNLGLRNVGLGIIDFFKSEIQNSKSEIELAGVAQLARASAFQAEGRGFEARLPLQCYRAHVAQEEEHILGKDEAGGSSPPVGSTDFGGIT